MFNNPIARVILMVTGIFYWLLQIATMAITGAICLLAGLVNLLCIKIFNVHDYRLSIVSLWVLSGAVFIKVLGDDAAHQMIYIATKGEYTFDEIWKICIDNFKKGLEED